MRTDKNRRVTQLEGLRFIMCCIIILSHLEFLGELGLFGKIYNRFFHNATMAVDYFFILSGFGIYLSNKRPDGGLANNIKFAINKIKKIYPFYILSLIMGIVWIFLSMDDINIKNILINTGYVLIDLSLLQSLTGMIEVSHSVNGVCWFLSSIFICYMLCPIFLKIMNRITNKIEAYRGIILTTSIIIILSIIASVIERFGSNYGINDIWYGHPFIRCWYLLIGMYCGWFYKNVERVFGEKEELSVVFVAVIYFLLRNSLLQLAGRNIMRVIDVLLCFFLIYIISQGDGIVSRFLKSKKIQLLASMSMYLYIFHYPIRMIVETVFIKYNINFFIGNFSYIIEVVLILILTMVIVYFFQKRGAKC